MTKNFNQQNQNNIYSQQNIRISLTEYYKNKDIYLPDGISYKLADIFKKISSNQLRKILSIVKQAIASESFEESKKIMYSIVPLTAYNSGRDKSLRNLYYFIKDHIKSETITNKEDIKTFDKLYTNIIAYHKTFGGK